MHIATGTSQHLVMSITKIIDWSSLVGEARMAKRNRVTRAAAGVVCPRCSKNSVVGFPHWRLADHMIFPNVPTTFAAFACLFDLKDFVHIIDDTPQATRKRASSRSRQPRRCVTARDPRTPLDGRGRGSRLSRDWKKAEEAANARRAFKDSAAPQQGGPSRRGSSSCQIMNTATPLDYRAGEVDAPMYTSLLS